MTIESDLSSIAKSLELIAQHLLKADHVRTTPNPSPAPVAAPVVATASPSSMTKEAFVSEVMGTYKALGPVKGAGIQAILTSHGAININDVKPEQYAAIVAQIKAL
jgi:hypothetical protein